MGPFLRMLLSSCSIACSRSVSSSSSSSPFFAAFVVLGSTFPTFATPSSLSVAGLSSTTFPSFIFFLPATLFSFCASSTIGFCFCGFGPTCASSVAAPTASVVAVAIAASCSFCNRSTLSNLAFSSSMISCRASAFFLWSMAATVFL